MKKIWSQPQLVTLDVRKTLAGTLGGSRSTGLSALLREAEKGPHYS